MSQTPSYTTFYTCKLFPFPHALKWTYMCMMCSCPLPFHQVYFIVIWTRAKKLKVEIEVVCTSDGNYPTNKTMTKKKEEDEVSWRKTMHLKSEIQ